jgi:hypothetical protein
MFDTVMFFDKVPVWCEVSCRMEDVRSKITKGAKRDHLEDLLQAMRAA